ncbi:Hydroxyindole-O-methyltransferase [Handroanthus impetiginosus]|uniref:Hydroxyindole-O-methyltransferase n=1 Tax=Handroanthus impetiginosus TaxID=429701 RepID=A0A2G9G4S2_9LAMI|nr:Hydroxyindole-O-methyltransferase [Handroanthus impetiginosus]
MDEEARANVEIWKYALGFAAMGVVKCAIELGLPDAMENHDGPMTLSQLSAAVGCPTGSLHRIMRFLTHNGIFKKELNLSKSQDLESFYYSQTALSRLLTRDKMGPFVLVQAGPPSQSAGLTAKDLKSGKGSGVQNINAPSEDIFWNMFEVDPAFYKLFQQFLASHAKIATTAVINYCPKAFEGIRCLVDVGGHEGIGIGMLVKAFPWIRGINFDLPNVIAGASPIDGVEHVAGNMFESVPKADAVMLMWILHDWSDDLCVDILKKCKEAIPADTGKVIIVDAIIDEEGGDEYTGARLAMDMTIMSATIKGKERTDKEWAQLLNIAGFSRHTIKHMKAIESVLEAYP